MVAAYHCGSVVYGHRGLGERCRIRGAEVLSRRQAHLLCAPDAGPRACSARVVDVRATAGVTRGRVPIVTTPTCRGTAVAAARRRAGIGSNSFFGPVLPAPDAGYETPAPQGFLPTPHLHGCKRARWPARRDLVPTTGSTSSACRHNTGSLNANTGRTSRSSSSPRSSATSIGSGPCARRPRCRVGAPAPDRSR